MFALSVVLLASAFLGYAAATYCPSEFVTRPCKCTSDELLECENITDASILNGVFQRIGDFRFRELVLVDSNIDFIPSAYLQQKRFARISIKNSQLKSIFDEVPESLSSVKFLIVRNVSFSNDFPWEQLKTFTKLQSLSATQVYIPSVGQSFKDNVSKYLRHFSLTGTNTTEIAEGAFSELEHLEKIKIQYCELEELKRSYFARPANIQVLLFNGNKIKTLPDDIFEDMPELKMIDLHRNELSTVSEEVFKKIEQKLVYVHLESNPLNCDCDLRWILTLTAKTSVFGTCEIPESLNGKLLKNLEENDFQSCN